MHDIATRRGALIAGMGLPACGKSTLFRKLAQVVQAQGTDVAVFLEPEEADWPEAVSERDKCGHITAITWFRAARVPMLHKAAELRRPGFVSLIDSYYDKLVARYMDDPAMSWLISRDDPYWEPFSTIAALDYFHLPDADCVVFIEVEESAWKEQLRQRGRELDKSADVANTYASQAAMLAASEQYCREKGIPHVRFRNDYSSLMQCASWLHDALVSHRVLPKQHS